MSLKTLNPKNKLFQILSKNQPKWWISLVDDDDIYIDIRKDNYIDVYYNGGNVIRELRYKSNSFQGKIHYKYIPLISDEDYIDYTFSSSSIHFIPLNILPLNNFDIKAIHLIKKQIKKYYPNKSEKGFQASFIKKDNNFIDTEFAYNDLRIDLVRIDIKSKKIVFIELKTKDDTRLLKKPYQAKSDIAIQLDKYQKFIKANKKILKVYYEKVFGIKKMLNILPTNLKRLNSISEYVVEEKPLLVIANCTQNWINENFCNIDLDLNKYAIGAYYFGKVNNCDLIIKTKGNRHIY